jgi:hypothetical protein
MTVLTSIAPIFIAIPVGIVSFCMVKAFVDFLKRNLDRNHPNVENDDELEAILVYVISKEFA